MENSNIENTQNLLKSKEQLKTGIAAIAELKLVDQLITQKFNSEAPMLSEISFYLHELGGKKMRPALCLLVAKALNLNPIPKSLIDIAAGIELIHMATLLHDDIIDKSELRRHQESAFIRYGTTDTLLTGDFLLVRAFSLCANLDQTIVAATEQACVELTEGEILEIPLSKQQASLEDALTIARKKTAALFKLAAFSAAHLAELSKEATQVFAEFGNCLGIAFQILDDILDVTSDTDLLGKVTGIDIRERKPSVVNILWLESGAAKANKLLSPHEPGQAEEAFINESLLELKESPVIDQARDLAKSYAEQARAHLKQGFTFAPSVNQEVAETIESFVDYTIERLY